MFELDSDDRLAVAALRSARETSVQTRVIREAAILVPCAAIFYFAIAWNDLAALWIGPGLYAGYRIYLSFVELARDRRLGEIIEGYEEAIDHLVHAIEHGEEVGAEDEDADDADVDAAPAAPAAAPEAARRRERDPAKAIARLFRDAADETSRASDHFRRAAEKFRSGKVPRGCAHAVAAGGHLREARRSARRAAAIHTGLADPLG